MHETYGSITVLGLVGLSRENDQSSLVGLQSSGVHFETLLRSVSSTVVNGDTNGERFLASDTGALQLLVRESSTLSQLGVVSSCGASDGRSEEINRSVDRAASRRWCQGREWMRSSSQRGRVQKNGQRSVRLDSCVGLHAFLAHLRNRSLHSAFVVFLIDICRPFHRAARGEG